MANTIRVKSSSLTTMVTNKPPSVSFDLVSRMLTLTEHVVFKGTFSIQYENNNYNFTVEGQFTNNSAKEKTINYQVHLNYSGKKWSSCEYSNVKLGPNSSVSCMEKIRFNVERYEDLHIYIEEFGEKVEHPIPLEMRRKLLNLCKDAKKDVVEFAVAGKNLKAHKLIVGARCQLLKAMMESAKGPVVIEDVKYTVFKCFLFYLYTEEVWHVNDFAKDFIRLANKFDMECLKRTCEIHLRETIEEDNILDLLMLANRYDCKILKQAALFDLKLYFNDITDLYGTEKYEMLKQNPELLLAVDKSIDDIPDDEFYDKEFCNEDGPFNPSNISRDFESLYNDDSAKDVKFVIEGETVMAHKLIVCTHSKVIKTMLESDMREKLEGMVKIDDVTMPVFRSFLKYLYTGRVEGIEKFAEDLMMLANKYEVECLKSTCEEYLCDRIDNGNVVRLLVNAYLIDCKRLKERAMVKLPSYIKGVWITDEEFEMLKMYPELEQEVLDRVS